MQNNILKLLPKMYFPGVIFHGEKCFSYFKNFFSDKNILVVISDSFKKYNETLCEDLFGEKVFYFIQEEEPSSENFERLKKEFLARNFNLIVAVGGGSVIDLAKLVKKEFSLQMIAIPTTIGSGAEVSQHCILFEDGIKRSFSDYNFIPETVILNPIFLASLSDEQIVYQSIDSLAHALESLVSRLSNPLSDYFALSAIENIYSGLNDLSEKGAQNNILEKIQIASVFSGLAQGNVATGLVHSFAHYFGAKNKISHARAVAIFLIDVLKFNLQHTSKYQKIDHLKRLSCDNFIHKIENLFQKLNVEIKIEVQGNLQEIAEEIRKDICTTTNPYLPSNEDIVIILNKLKNG
ncbi:MAG: iron-containing alcohol dehydrogenase [Candidatus Shapirobacteria bacterium]|jgi:alcohol dehydrogenase class IV